VAPSRSPDPVGDRGTLDRHAMVYMGHDEREVVLVASEYQEIEKSERIRSAGHGYQCRCGLQPQGRQRL
jgi:hypothetical protein